MKIAYHFTGTTLHDGRPVPPVGEWLEHSGPLVLCLSGLHACVHPFDALRFAPACILHKVELAGTVVTGSDKIVASRRRIIASIDATNLLRGFARQQALSVIHLWDPPKVVLDYLNGDGDAANADANANANANASARVAASANAAYAVANAASAAYANAASAAYAACANAAYAACAACADAADAAYAANAANASARAANASARAAYAVAYADASANAASAAYADANAANAAYAACANAAYAARAEFKRLVDAAFND